MSEFPYFSPHVFSYTKTYVEAVLLFFIQFDELPPLMAEETPFIFLRLNILRESLERELVMTGLPFPYDFEVNMIDMTLLMYVKYVFIIFEHL